MPERFAPSEAEGVPDVRDQERREELYLRLRQANSQAGQQRELDKLFQADVPLGVLCDILAFTAGINPLSAQELLSETDVNVRCDRLLNLLGTFAEIGRKESPTEYPPPFSLN